MASASVEFKLPCSDMPSSPNMRWGLKKTFVKLIAKLQQNKINNSKMFPFIIASILEVKKKHK